jgi:hypothetical protein
MLGNRSLPHRRAMLTNQTFRDIYRTDASDVDQRLKITSLTFLSPTSRLDRDVRARGRPSSPYDLVQAPLRVLNEIVADEAGAS